MASAVEAIDDEIGLRALFEQAKRWTLDSALSEDSLNINRQDVEELRQWCIKQNVIPDVPDYQLIAFLHSCENDIDKVHTTMRVYHKTRNSVPEVFSDRSFRSEDVQSGIAVAHYCILPKTTPDGYRIVAHSMRDPDVEKYVYTHCTKAQFLVLDMCVRADPTAKGYIFLSDAKDISMAHVWKGGYRLPQKLSTYFQEGMPLRMHSLHILNSSPVVAWVMRMMKRLIRQEVREMMHFHTPDDMEDFFSMVPRDCVPEDFGGTLPSMEKLQADTDWFVISMEDLLS